MDAGDYGADPGELSDAEFEAMMAAAEAEAGFTTAAEQFDTAFAERAAAEQAREQARLEFGRWTWSAREARRGQGGQGVRQGQSRPVRPAGRCPSPPTNARSN